MELKELTGLCERIREIKDEKATLASREKELNAELSGLEQIVLDELRNQGIGKLTTEFGTVYDSCHYSIKTEDKGKLYKFLASKGIEVTDLLSINSQTLNAVLKPYAEAGEVIDGAVVTEYYKLNMRRN